MCRIDRLKRWLYTEVQLFQCSQVLQTARICVWMMYRLNIIKYTLTRHRLSD